jgi:hypothetical protein
VWLLGWVESDFVNFLALASIAWSETRYLLQGAHLKAPVGSCSGCTNMWHWWWKVEWHPVVVNDLIVATSCPIINYYTVHYGLVLKEMVVLDLSVITPLLCIIFGIDIKALSELPIQGTLVSIVARSMQVNFMYSYIKLFIFTWKNCRWW